MQLEMLDVGESSYAFNCQSNESQVTCNNLAPTTLCKYSQGPSCARAV